MNKFLVSSYLSYIRGSSPWSPWNVLRPFGVVGKGYSSFRNMLYRRGWGGTKEPPLPVISVGNLSLGGTNKTPFVAMITRKLQEAGLRPGIVSRGYSASVQGVRVLKNGRGERDAVGDEPLLLSTTLPGVPLALSPQRLQGVEALGDEGCNVVVADDAFQHRKLGRDVDLLLIDAACPFGNRRHFPDGVLREGLEAIQRAHGVILTKIDQAAPEDRARLLEEVRGYTEDHRIFCSRLVLSRWFRVGSPLEDAGGSLREVPPPGEPLLAFSAIGNPQSFRKLLEQQQCAVVGDLAFRDHHRFSPEDMAFLEERALALGARGLVCTEKDLWNLPGDAEGHLPLYVPRVRTEVEEESRFWAFLADQLRPRLVVASNGYGEDAVGALLAARLSRAYPFAEVGAFALVGNGRAYRERNIPVYSPSCESPSGGIVKYSLRVLFRELRGGLGDHIREQLRCWGTLRAKIRTVLCVGDVYLLIHTLLGQGQLPALVATAKSMCSGGHWKVERALLRRWCRAVWTRDEPTARELEESGVAASFAGNPLMDLGLDYLEESPPFWESEEVPKLLLLPGSRDRAYDDLPLLLRTLELLKERKKDTLCLMIPAGTLERKKLRTVAENLGWKVCAEEAQEAWHHPGGASVVLYSGPLALGARKADLLLGLGGTANQVCAGLGVPVLSIREKGKLVQKKLLGDAEKLAEPFPEVLAREITALLEAPDVLERMAQAGRKAMGSPGSMERILEDMDRLLGWGSRCEVFARFAAFCGREAKEEKTDVHCCGNTSSLCQYPASGETHGSHCGGASGSPGS